MIAIMGGHTYLQQIAIKITNARVWPRSVAFIFMLN